MADWVWDGGRLSLDLLNTLRDRPQGGRETLRTTTDLAAWLREAGLPGIPGEDDLRAVRRLRAAIDALAFPLARPPARDPARGPGTGDPGRDAPISAAAAVMVINAAAADMPMPRLVLDPCGRPAMVPPEASAAAALAEVAVDAIDRLTGDEPLRVCAAHDCGIRFVDRSPARNRQWCSMRRCGNRAKARRHYGRTRG